MINDIKVTNQQMIADNFNLFFTTIGPMLAAKINSNGKLPVSHYLQQPTETTFSFSMIQSDEILKIVSNFLPKSSAGHDGLSMKIIKRVIVKLSEPLCVIINQSLFSGIFPYKLKIARVIPVFKKDDNTILDNYRPISILPCISKIFEKIVLKKHGKQLVLYYIVIKRRANSPFSL